MNDIERVIRDLEISSGRHSYGRRSSISMEEVAGATTGSRRHSYRSSRRINDEDEEALKWAALQRLPTYDRLRTSILRSIVSDEKVVIKEVDVRKLDMDERQRFMDRFIQVAEEDNEKFLSKFRDRLDKVGIQLPTLEVRFEHLSVEVDCHVGRRALPTLPNVTRNIAESAIAFLGIHLAKRKKLTILNDVSGIVKPSRMTLLLGPPSSGKTTFLLALADKLDPCLKVEGEITYNGYRIKEFVPRKTSAYISQNDVHVSELTVRETLDFSARCQGVGTRYELLREIARREKNAGIHPDAEVDLFMKETAVGGAESSLITDYVLKILGLEICEDTIVGDEMQRGISGGQKKRVTTGEIIVGPTKALFMDDISTGLDSSTTFQIVKCLQQIAHHTEATILMSLLQPAPETYDLFDDIILISEGQIVYQGPREHILDFFETSGFRCPERKGTADFLLEVTSRKDQEQYWVDRSKPYRYVGVKEFANQFKRFHVGQQLDNELSNPFDKCQSHAGALVFKEHSVPTTELLKANFHKEWTLIKRNSLVYVFTTFGTIVVALIGSTVFFKTNMHTSNEEDGITYLGAIIFSIVNNMFNAYAELAVTITRLPVFYKHRDLLFHPAWTYTLPNALLKVPISLIEAIAWTAVTYYTTGYSSEASRFFKTILVLFVLKEMANACFRLVPGVCRTMTVASTAAALTTLFVYLLGGFILPRGGTAIVTDRIPVGWSWGYWVSPMSYAFNALAVNEMLAPRWMNKLASDDATRLGVAVLKNFDINPESRVYWIGVAALLGFALLFNILYTISLMYLNPLGKPQANISEEVANEIDFEQKGKMKSRISNSNRKGEIEILQMSSQSMVNGQNKVTKPEPRRGMVLPFIPLAMSFDSVNYYVDMPSEMKDKGVGCDKLQLLQEVTGAFRPGILAALMGVSGAGKTTLMDVLAGRKTGGYIEGDIRISGFPKKQETFARISGYCEQNDIHSPHVTVRESLIYSAYLRLPKEVSNKEKMIFVDEVMNLVGLDNLRDAIVGLPGVTGLSTEQRKRLTIAVELVANPSIIFMDEPTTGLDARAAAIVMRTVRNTVDTGRTVVCTIHQPSVDIFEAFDELLLLKRGGQVIYSGPLGRHSQKLIEYFESIPGVSKIKDKYNPGTWMLEVSSTAAEIQLKLDFAEYYKSSSLYQQNKTLVKELSSPPPGGNDLRFCTQYSQSSWGQFKSCLWKQWWTYWRSPSYNLVRFSFTLVTAILIGSIFWQIGTKRNDTTDLQIIVGVLCTAVMFLGIANSTTVRSIVYLERTVFYRESAAGMYSSLPYALAWVIVEIPYVFVQTTYYTLIVYAMVCFQWTRTKFFWFFFINFFTFLYFTYYGMMVISITPNDLLANVFAAAFYSLFNLFSGFFIPRPRIPKWWAWYYWICPVAWTVYGLIISQYGDVEDTIMVPGIMLDPTIKWYIEHHFGYDSNFMGPVAGVLVSFTIFFALMFAFCIGKLNFQTR